MDPKISVLILCGGKGTRLGKLGKKTPKSLVKLDNESILKHLIKFINKNISTQIIISGHYMLNSFTNFLSKNKFPNVELYDDGDIDILERIKINLIRKRSRLLVLYGDELANVNLEKLIKFHKRSKKILTITTYKYFSNFGILMKKNNKYFFKEKPFIGHINIGFMVFDYENINYIERMKKLDNYFIKLCEIKKINSFEHTGYHITFNSLAELEHARKSIKKIHEK